MATEMTHKPVIRRRFRVILVGNKGVISPVNNQGRDRRK